MAQDSEKPKRGKKLTTLADFPTERCSEMPEPAELMIAMKFVRKIRINRKKKYRALLADGILEMHNPKHNTTNAFSIEYLVDLARVGLQFDDERLVVKLQTETLLLYPLTITIEKFRDLMHKHRLWRQEKTSDQSTRNHEPDTSAKGQLTACSPARSPTTFDPSTDSVFTETETINPFHDFLKSVHSTSLAVLDISSRNLEKMTLISEGIKEIIELLKNVPPKTENKLPEGAKFDLNPDVNEAKKIEEKPKAEPKGEPKVETKQSTADPKPESFSEEEEDKAEKEE